MKHFLLLLGFIILFDLVFKLQMLITNSSEVESLRSLVGVIIAGYLASLFDE